MKRSIIEPIPVILFDTEGQGRFWSEIDNQMGEMIGHGRPPSWIPKNIIITDDPGVGSTKPRPN
jgi:hypothetical protein